MANVVVGAEHFAVVFDKVGRRLHAKRPGELDAVDDVLVQADTLLQARVVVQGGPDLIADFLQGVRKGESRTSLLAQSDCGTAKAN